MNAKRSPKNPRQPRRPNFNFDKMGVEMGSKLVLVSDNTIKAEVISPKRVSCNGKEYSLSGLAKELFGAYITPCKPWTYNGRNLDDIYEATYPHP
jgi:hypothetical protein